MSNKGYYVLIKYAPSLLFGYTLLTSCDRFLSVNSHRWALELLMPDINNATFALSSRKPNCGRFLCIKWLRASIIRVPDCLIVKDGVFTLNFYLSHRLIVSHQDPWNAWGCWCGLLLFFPGTAHARLQVSILSKTTIIWIMIYLSLKLVKNIGMSCVSLRRNT